MAKEPQMAEVDIGELLSTKRSEKGLSVAVAASKTKLSSDSINYLESNQFSEIGTPVYVRGYLSIYANFLGLDAAGLIQLYNTQHPSAETDVRPAVNTVTTKKRIKRHSKTVSALVALMTFAGLSYAYSRIEPLVFSMPEKVLEPKAETVDETPLSAIDSTIQASQNAKSLAEDALNGLPVSGNHVVEKATEDDTLATDAEVANLPKLTLESTIELESLNESETSETQQDLPPTGVKKGQMSLDLRFNNECWLKVSDNAGKVLASGTFGQKKQLSVIGKGPFTVTTWRPEAIVVTVFNGKPVNIKQYQTGKKTYQLK